MAHSQSNGTTSNNPLTAEGLRSTAPGIAHVITGPTGSGRSAALYDFAVEHARMLPGDPHVLVITPSYQAGYQQWCGLLSRYGEVAKRVQFMTPQQLAVQILRADERRNGLVPGIHVLSPAEQRYMFRTVGEGWLRHPEKLYGAHCEIERQQLAERGSWAVDYADQDKFGRDFARACDREMARRNAIGATGVSRDAAKLLATSRRASTWLARSFTLACVDGADAYRGGHAGLLAQVARFVPVAVSVDDFDGVPSRILGLPTAAAVRPSSQSPSPSTSIDRFVKNVRGFAEGPSATNHGTIVLRTYAVRRDGASLLARVLNDALLVGASSPSGIFESPVEPNEIAAVCFDREAYNRCLAAQRKLAAGWRAPEAPTLLDDPEVMRLVTLLRVLVRREDPEVVAALRVLGVESDSIKILQRRFGRRTSSLAEVISDPLGPWLPSPSQRRGIVRLRGILDVGGAVHRGRPAELVTLCREVLRYCAAVPTVASGPRIVLRSVRPIDAFIEHVGRYERTREVPSLQGLLDTIAVTDFAEDAPASPGRIFLTMPDGVRGRRFKRVYLIGLVESKFIPDDAEDAVYLERQIVNFLSTARFASEHVEIFWHVGRGINSKPSIVRNVLARVPGLLPMQVYSGDARILSDQA